MVVITATITGHGVAIGTTTAAFAVTFVTFAATTKHQCTVT